ncbi:MAG TPA: DUF4345 family protein [Solirubrobacterales bacterium]|nr:DUF4345 family protein [Solirubrobacterales bacterium]
MRSPAAARAALVFLCLYCVFIGALAAFAPHTFYGDFPFVTHWVDLLPLYNEHLVTDVGGLYLGFAVLFGWAAWRPEPNLTRAASTAFIVVAVLHLVFHAFHLDGFGTADAVAEIAGLASLLIWPALAIWAAGPPVRRGT